MAKIRVPSAFYGFRGSVFRSTSSLNAPQHTVCVIGFDNTGWIILNSMGSGWGEGGCATVAFRFHSLLDFRLRIPALKHTPSFRSNAFSPRLVSKLLKLDSTLNDFVEVFFHSELQWAMDAEISHLSSDTDLRSCACETQARMIIPPPY
jgi:hypothetical protein